MLPLEGAHSGRHLLVAIFLGLLLAAMAQNAVVGLAEAAPSVDPREGWAVLLDMNDYPEGYTDLPTGYNDSQMWTATLHGFGWQSDHVQLVRGTLTRSVGEAAARFLINNADANDVALFFIFAHGTWIQNAMQWSDWFPSMWSSVGSQNKLLVVSACGAEAFIDAANGEAAPHLHIASAGIGEYAWAGLPEEGLPIIGEVFNQFLTAAFFNGSADANGNGEVTVEEAFAFASPASRAYITVEVFPRFSDYAEMCNHVAPTPVLDDGYPGELSLKVEPGDAPANPLLPLLLVLIVFVVSVAVIVPVFVVMRHPKPR
jgi:hypothetical protein